MRLAGLARLARGAVAGGTGAAVAAVAESDGLAAGACRPAGLAVAAGVEAVRIAELTMAAALFVTDEFLCNRTGGRRRSLQYTPKSH